MAKKSAADPKKPITVIANDPEALKGRLKRVGGSQSDHWNDILANQTGQALWLAHSDEETRSRQCSAAVAGLIGIGQKTAVQERCAIGQLI
jgi:hypothetical protein